MFSNKVQFLTFFVMTYSSVRLGSYLVNGYVSKFKFPVIHRYIGTIVYAVFLIAFVLFEFVIYKSD